MWRLACNPIYIVTCLGACMELIIVSGFVVFLPKYLETQFSLGKSQASVFTGNSLNVLIVSVSEVNYSFFRFYCNTRCMYRNIYGRLYIEENGTETKRGRAVCFNFERNMPILLRFFIFPWL